MNVYFKKNALRNARCVLLCFEAVLCRMINLAKSELVMVGDDWRGFPNGRSIGVQESQPFYALGGRGANLRR